MTRRRTQSKLGHAMALAFVAALSGPAHAQGGKWTVVGWNNLGMHCMDADYAVFSLLPPYNTIYAQLIDPQGRLVTDPAGVTVTYEAVADPDGSINRTSHGKTNFWQFVQALFGVTLEPDVGLAQHAMPGIANLPQPMSFDSAGAWFIAEGIPITPYDDANHRNSYPLMRLVARDTSGAMLASSDIVLPVSDEMDCKSCHASGSSPAAQPLSGWVRDPDPDRDMRLNVIHLHDDRNSFNDQYKSTLVAAGYNPAGLFETVMSDGTSILCARCHASEALPGTGIAGIKPLTQAVHGRMAYVLDPVSGMTLENTDNRSACYRCHPGSVTRCLRGAMGSAVAPDGSLAIQCQSCHGSMTQVASPDRTGWLNEPACQSCHTGTAISNSGEIRYLSAFDASGTPRVAADQTFATNSDTPAPGLSLYRFSKGHGGLACEACHGPTHAEFPSSQRNDNIQSMQHQGHVGTLVECATCHAGQPNTVDGGPHGMHPIGQAWVAAHSDVVGEGEGDGNAASSAASNCRSCHGADYRGTVLSRSQADRTLRTELGTKQFWRGFQIGCYTCHNGPNGGDANRNQAPIVSDTSLSATADTPATLTLNATDPNGDVLALRIVSQPSHGAVGLDGTVATYIPEAGFTGDDTFTFAAWDGSTDSNLGHVSVSVAGAPPTPMPTSAACAGDCNRSHDVSIDELLSIVNMALSIEPMTGCATADRNGDGQITIDEILAAVNAALSGCPGR